MSGGTENKNSKIQHYYHPVQMGKNFEHKIVIRIIDGLGLIRLFF